MQRWALPLLTSMPAIAVKRYMQTTCIRTAHSTGNTGSATLVVHDGSRLCNLCTYAQEEGFRAPMHKKKALQDLQGPGALYRVRDASNLS